MEKWKIIPTVSVNGIAFGESRDVVREIIGHAFQEFKKTPIAKNTTDAYADYHVYYDDQNRFEAIEFFGDVKVYVGRCVVFPGKIGKAQKIFADLVDDGYGYTSQDASVGITLADDNVTIDGILFGCKDYYK